MKLKTLWALLNMLLILSIIIYDIVYFIIWIAKLYICRGIVECKNRKCHVKDRCYRYSEKLTPEEYERLKKLIEELDDLP